MRVTVSASWAELYDQGGLAFILPPDPEESKAEEATRRKWIKTGIEFYDDQAFVSTVAADRWADWSLMDTGVRRGKEVTLEMEKDGVEGTLWVYVVPEGGKRVPIREVTWVLSEGVGDAGQERECWVGVYAAKPTVGTDGERKGLIVEFRDFELIVKS